MLEVILSLRWTNIYSLLSNTTVTTLIHDDLYLNKEETQLRVLLVVAFTESWHSGDLKRQPNGGPMPKTAILKRA